MKSRSAWQSFFGTALKLLKLTVEEWLQDKAPQLGAALAYYTVFSLAPLTLGQLAMKLLRVAGAGICGGPTSVCAGISVLFCRLSALSESAGVTCVPALIWNTGSATEL